MPSASESSLANVGGAAVWYVVLLVHRRFVCSRNHDISLLCGRYWNHDETNNLPSKHEDTNNLNKVKNSISQFLTLALPCPSPVDLPQVDVAYHRRPAAWRAVIGQTETRPTRPDVPHPCEMKSV